MLASGMQESLPLPTMGTPTFETADGRHVSVAFNPIERGVFVNYLSAMEQPELGEDPRFASREARAEHRSELLEVIHSWALKFETAEEFEAHLQRFGLVGGIVRPVSEAAQLEWAKERGAFVEVSDRGDGMIQVPNTPWRFSNAHSGGEGIAAYRGENNRDVIRHWLEMEDDEISELEAIGVLTQRGPSGRS